MIRTYKFTSEQSVLEELLKILAERERNMIVGGDWRK